MSEISQPISLTISLTEEEERLVNRYAQAHSMTVSEAFKQALFEKIEDEYDLALYEEDYKEYVDSGYKSYSFEELLKELELDDT